MGMNGTPIDIQPKTHSNYSAPAVAHRSQAWHLEYMAALFETDRTQIGGRIKRAEQLILSRERELFAETADTAERRALNNALHGLHALRNCLGV
jgi:hypothetical protein